MKNDMLSKENEYGLQPLNELLERLNLQNDDLVQRSTQQLTYKQIQKARKGRRVTLNIKKNRPRGECLCAGRKI